MRPALPLLLVNTPEVELWPATLCPARGNATARILAGSELVLRRKRDGRHLAALDRRRIRPLLPGLAREPGLEAAIAALEVFHARHPETAAPGRLPGDAVHAENAAMGLPSDYAERSGLPFHEEPRVLRYAGRDRYRRPLWLLAPAARAWRAMRAAALREGVPIEAISGYRSHAYQRGIFARKFARGLTLEAVLAVNAAPGYSEHHGGCALDLGSPGEPAAEEGFERSPAYAWLQARAGAFGFRLSYPRGNPHGIVFEPWHWCWHPPDSPAQA
jgi:D-alanyl-D-alanine carboxypeptidase